MQLACEQTCAERQACPHIMSQAPVNAARCELLGCRRIRRAQARGFPETPALCAESDEELVPAGGGEAAVSGDDSRGPNTIATVAERACAAEQLPIRIAEAATARRERGG